MADDKPTENKLTLKQQLFAEAYLETSNATESARRAGYRGDDNTLRQVACENLTKPNITDYIDARIKPVLRRAKMSADEVLTELALVAQTPLSPKYAGPKVRALEILARHHGLLQDYRKNDEDVKRERCERAIELLQDRARQRGEEMNRLTAIGILAALEPEIHNYVS